MELIKKKNGSKINKLWKREIKSKGLKQTWIAEQIGLSPEHLSNILAGRAEITEENKLKINAVLGTDF